jgi:hypothetical protein
VVFWHDGANQLVQILRNLEITRFAIQDYLDRDADLPDGLLEDSVLDAVTALQNWLSQIQASQVGLLSVG